MASQQFQDLQSQLVRCWQGSETFVPDSTQAQIQSRDIVVIPSLSFPQRELAKITGYTHYEERQLYTLIQLRNPHTRMIYVTSQPLHPSIVDYYLDLLPGIPSSHARERLLLLATYDYSDKPLTAKILERPRLIARMSQAIRKGAAYMVCFNATGLEQELALKLGIPLYAVNPDLLYWGTKAGSRELFAEAGISHPDGSGLIQTETELAAEILALWQRNPGLERVVVKLNEAFSGEGNALLDLRPLARTSDQLTAITQALSQMQFQAPQETWESYRQRFAELGGIVECFLEGQQKQSPSVQGQVTPVGQVEIISTHDQILDAPDGQIFLGCSFPAAAPYRLKLQEYGLKIGETLARKGVIGHYGVDFIARPMPNADTWDLQAIEINLRKGGTTHPFMTLKFLTNGCYDPETGLFFSYHHRPKYYIASDNLRHPNYHGLLPNDLLDMIARYHLHFDSSTETGSVFHLMGALSEFGKLGITSIGNSLEEAHSIYDQTITLLDQASA